MQLHKNIPPYAKGAQKPASVDYKRIATEEAWGPPEMFKMYLDLIENGALTDPGFVSMWGRIVRNKTLVDQLQDIGDECLQANTHEEFPIQQMLSTSCKAASKSFFYSESVKAVFRFIVIKFHTK